MATKPRPKEYELRHHYGPEVVEKCLLAVVENNGNVSAAGRQLKAEGVPVGERTVNDWVKRKYRRRYLELRLESAPDAEQHLARDMLDIAIHTTRAQHLAIEKARERLEADKEQDPARAAVNLARVSQMNIDKMLALTGRPVQIRESNDVEGLLRGLVAIGVLKPPDEPKHIDTTAEEDVA